MKRQVLHTVWCTPLERLQEKFKTDHSWVKGLICYAVHTQWESKTCFRTVQAAFRMPCIFCEKLPPLFHSTNSTMSPATPPTTPCTTPSSTSRDSWIPNSPRTWRSRRSGAVLRSYWLRRASCQSTAPTTRLCWTEVRCGFNVLMEQTWQSKAYL